MNRAVTERDLRHPAFAEGEPSDYEFRPDGRIVRKDRWEMAIHSIRYYLGDHRREFEVSDIVGAVKAMVASYPDREDEAPALAPRQDTNPERSVPKASIAQEDQ